MAAWKRDFASGLVVLVPVLVTAYVIAWLYGVVANVTPASVISSELLRGLFGVDNPAVAELARVSVTLVVFVVLVFAVGYLMRTTAGDIAETVLDNLANRLPGLRVVYNASKMAAETALGGTETLQKPVKIETWNGIRMTAFKTGKRTEDGREVLFLPTAPNITSGFVVEIDTDDLTETDESVEDALTRILSAGFGDNGEAPAGMPIDVVDERADGNGDGDGDGENTKRNRDPEAPSPDD
jgi:uncharacterized membrane protein